MAFSTDGGCKESSSFLYAIPNFGNWRVTVTEPTRLPAYAMGRVGQVVMLHGNHVLPDSNAHFEGEAPDPLYAVELDARTLWDGDAEDAGDRMVLDLWQNYLEPANS